MTDRPIKVAVNGALGRMGQTVLGAVEADPVTIAVGGADSAASADTVEVPDGNPVPLAPTLAELLSKVDADVVVDFSNGAGAVEAMAAATGAGVRVVSGSTGVQSGELERFGAIAAEKDIGIISASNFALGAVLMIHLARESARFFDYAELTEIHHEAKIDAPSGFALALAKSIGDRKQFARNYPERENLPGTRGGEYNGVTIHSVRMPGRSAHHEVILGAPGQTVSLRHDTLGRDCYMPGVLRCIREVVKRPGLVVGLENILGL